MTDEQTWARMSWTGFAGPKLSTQKGTAVGFQRGRRARSRWPRRVRPGRARGIRAVFRRRLGAAHVPGDAWLDRRAGNPRRTVPPFDRTYGARALPIVALLGTLADGCRDDGRRIGPHHVRRTRAPCRRTLSTVAL